MLAEYKYPVCVYACVKIDFFFFFFYLVMDKEHWLNILFNHFHDISIITNNIPLRETENVCVHVSDFRFRLQEVYCSESLLFPTT